MSKPLPTKSDFLCARSCIASARQALQDAIPMKQKARNAKADYAAFCLWLASRTLDGCQRGLMDSVANRAGAAQRLEGSNPSPSANRKDTA